MKSFIIHSFQDRFIIESQLQEIVKKCSKFEPMMMPQTESKHWRATALAKIRQADCAVYFVSDASTQSANVDWELKKFIHYDKPIYTIRLSTFTSSCHYNDILNRKEKFGNLGRSDRNLYSEEVDIDRLIQYVNNNLEMNIEEAIVCNKGMDEDILIEQYKAYLQTSEDVVARRQTVSNFYISVNSALLSVLSALVAILNALNIDHSLLTTIAICYLVPVLGIVLCFNWWRIIGSYGQLNAAKMKVIAAIEKNLPFDIYDIEWKVQTDRLGKRKYTSFTSIEKLIPVIFSVIYAVIFVVAVVLTCLYL